MQPPPDQQPFDGRVPPPRFAGVETTKFCNLQCRMCVQYNDGTTVAGPHMELDEFERVAAAVFPFVELWQPSVSGEPLLAKGMQAMLALGAEHDVRVTIYTNGTLLTDDVARQLAPQLDSATFSVDGSSRTTFESIRRGADFDQVLANVRGLVRHCREALPAERQPWLGLNCVLMRRNVGELPDLVALAADLGLDFVGCNHVFPVDDEMRQQSLAHDAERGRAAIAAAVRVAAERGVQLWVDDLDGITASAAGASPVEGLGHHGSTRPRSVLEGERPTQRAAAAAAAGFPPAYAGHAAAHPPIGYCDFLWNKVYVTIGGDVRTCCVLHTPVAGNLHQDSFPSIWNGEVYRVMRQRLAMQDPVPACRGCTHLRTLVDERDIAAALGGMRAPTAAEAEPLPPAMQSVFGRRHRRGPPPQLEWAAVEGARGYVVECSLDGFGSLLFSTSGPMGGPAVRDNRYVVPNWAWREAPVDREIQWRVLARLPAGDAEVARGVLPPEPAGQG